MLHYVNKLDTQKSYYVKLSDCWSEIYYMLHTFPYCHQTKALKKQYGKHYNL